MIQKTSDYILVNMEDTILAYVKATTDGQQQISVVSMQTNSKSVTTGTPQDRQAVSNKAVAVYSKPMFNTSIGSYLGNQLWTDESFQLAVGLGYIMLIKQMGDTSLGMPLWSGMVVMTKTLFASWNALSFKQQLLVAGTGVIVTKYGPKKVLQSISDATDTAVGIVQHVGNALPVALMAGAVLFVVVGNLPNKRQKT